MMLWRAIVHGLQAARARWLLSLTSITTIAFVLLLAAIPWLALTSLESLAARWAEHAPMAALLEDELTPQGQLAALAALRTLKGLEAATLLTPAQSLERLRHGSAEARELAASIDASVLPTIVELTPASGHQTLAQLELLAQAAGGVAGVVEVDYGQHEFAELQTLATKLRAIGTWLAAFVLLGAVLIVANTVRLTVYARQDEITIQYLVGATATYVRAPFVIEGLLWGLLGGGLAFAVLQAATPWLATLPIPLAVEPASFASLSLAAGSVLGLAASLLALLRLPGDQQL